MGIRMRAQFKIVAGGYRKNDFVIDPDVYDPVLNFLHQTLVMQENNPLVVRSLKSFSGEEQYMLYGLSPEDFREDCDQTDKDLRIVYFLTLQDFRDTAYKNTLSQPNNHRLLAQPSQPDLALSLADRLYRQLPIRRERAITEDDLDIVDLIKNGPFDFTTPLLQQFARGITSLLLSGGRYRQGVKTTNSAHQALEALKNPPPSPSNF